MTIKIEKGIPIPPPKRDGRAGRYGTYRHYPWKAMEIGDSFAVSFDEDAMRAQTRMNGVLQDRRKRHPERFTCRVCREHRRNVIRVWRTS